MAKEEPNFKIDVKETLLRNLMWIPLMIFVMIFSIIALGKVDLFLDEGFQIMFLIFSLFFTLKLFVWVGHPEIILREVEK